MDRITVTGTDFMPTVESPGVSEPSFVEALVDPGSVFGTPDEVVAHPWFSDIEKRTILLSWARDELVVEHVAAKALPELKPHSRIDAVIAALARFDASAASEYLSAANSIRATRMPQAAAAEPVMGRREGTFHEETDGRKRS